MVDIQFELANPRQNGVTIFRGFLDDLLYVFPVHLVGNGGAQDVQGLLYDITIQLYQFTAMPVFSLFP